MPASGFSGFPPKGLLFFKQLEKNNTRKWFQQHKQDYLENVVAPARELVEVMGPQLEKIIPQIRYDSAPNRGSIMRIYRDIRFSKDKTPYHKRLRLLFWTGEGKKTDNPGIYMGFNHHGAKVHVGIHGFSSTQLTKYRQAVLDSQHGKKLSSLMTKIQRNKDYSTGGLHYKRVPRGFPPDHPQETLLRHNGLYTSSPDIPLDIVTSPRLVSTILRHCRKMAPIISWLVNIF